MSELSVKSFVFDGSGSILKMAAKQYVGNNSGAEGLTLLFAHCVGSHKEQWEPTIARIIELQESKEKSHRIREAWSFDWQSHGDAAVLNQDILKTRVDSVSATEWALAIESLVRSPHLHGHRIVAIGHSAGTGAIMMSMKNFSIEESPYLAVFLVEPTMLSQQLFDDHAAERYAFSDATKKFTLERRDSWNTKEAALQWLGKRMPWKSWDRRVLKLYAEHGLRTIKLAKGETHKEAAILKCDRRQEGMSYPHFAPYIEATAIFSKWCTVLPIHVIFGSRTDFVPSYIQESLIDTAQGRIPASVTKVPGAGHMIVQESPDALAGVISDKLNLINQPLSRSRL